MSTSIERYYQKIGRAVKARQDVDCILCYQKDLVERLKEILLRPHKKDNFTKENVDCFEYRAFMDSNKNMGNVCTTLWKKLDYVDLLVAYFINTLGRLNINKIKVMSGDDFAIS